MRGSIKLLLLLVASGASTFAQTQDVDSIRLLLSGEHRPLQRFNLLNALGTAEFMESGQAIDSSLVVEMFQIAQSLGQDSTLAISYNWLGTYLNSKGDYPKALEYLFKALPLAESTNDKRRISSLYFDISLIYAQMGDYESQFVNAQKGGRNLPDKSHPLYDYMLIQYISSMSGYYLGTGKPDSAIYYAKQIEDVNKRLGDILNFTFLYNSFSAGAYAEKGEIELANLHYKNCLGLLEKLNSDITRSYFFYPSYLTFLMRNDGIDEAFGYAHQCLKFGILRESNYLIRIGSGFLRRIFESRNQIDSAYFFSRIEAEAMAAIFDQKDQDAIQALAFNEQLRLMEVDRQEEVYRNQMRQYALIIGLTVFLVIAGILYFNNRQKQRANKELEVALQNLKSTQAQLIQSEKMASLGELTAGIAHEIQNPLNFVNNFAEVNSELIAEMKAELEKGNIEQAKDVANNIDENEKKISYHGRRADGIVKSMLQHSRSSTGKKEPTDLNALADEYLRLAYHGLRAKDKSFNAKFEAKLDPAIDKVTLVPQEIGRVFLNLINNAFYSVSEKRNAASDGFEPRVTVITKKLKDKVEVRISDNGNGIVKSVREKIFQPFFTTKPTGQGTGLGLSMSYDIITNAHKGEIRVESNEGEGATFIIVLPLTD